MSEHDADGGMNSRIPHLPAPAPSAPESPRRLRKQSDYAGVTCPFCVRTLDLEGRSAGIWHCSYCERGFEAVPFKPVRSARTSQPSVRESGGSCAAHENNPASSECSRCGAFMCGVCRIDADGMVLCPSCFDRLAAEGALPSARTSFRNYPGLAWLSGVAGFFLWFLWVAIGPLIVFYGVMGIRQKRSLKETDGVASLYVVILLGLTEFVLGILILYWIGGEFLAALA